MIKPERLPDQVIAAFDHAFLEERQSGWTLDMAYRHAFAAALAAWPGAEQKSIPDPFQPFVMPDHPRVRIPALILPVRELLSEEIIRLERDKWA
jgi:hypothetical protein